VPPGGARRARSTVHERSSDEEQRMSRPEARTRWSENRLSPVHWRLRTKLIAALLVPVLLALALGALRVGALAGDAREFDRVARFAGAQGSVADLVERVGEERYRAAAFLTGRVDEQAFRTTAAEVDDSIATTLEQVGGLVAEAPRLAGALDAVRAEFEALPDVRGVVLGRSAEVAVVLPRYTAMVARVDELESAVLRGVTAPDTSGLALALERLSAVRNEVSLQYALVTAGTAVPDEAPQLLGSEARLGAGVAEFASALDPDRLSSYRDFTQGDSRSARAQLIADVTAGAGAGAGETGQNVRVIFDAALFDVDDTQRAVRADLTAASEQARADAVRQAVVNAVVLGLAVLIGFVLVAMITRAMVRSLGVLRNSATEIAQRTLPDAVHALRERSASRIDVQPVPVRSREEIGEVARSFDAVHLQAVRLAEEQAMLQTDVSNMFVNLSRRSQSLVDRQLALIKDLERSEVDRGRLVELHRLDNLATRMRRNSENLLVFAGTDMTKRAVRRVALDEVLHAAAADVEQTGRIVIRPAPGLAVVGRVANDLQHLLSELLDNAASYSSPDSTILMTSFRPPGKPLFIDVCDSGVGMPLRDMVDANRVLQAGSDASADAARRMGFFVVGRLANRHRITVRLIEGYAHEDGRIVADRRGSAGVTARVAIPVELIDGVVGTDGVDLRQQRPDAPLALR
jgi:signal transduction histidine kinase